MILTFYLGGNDVDLGYLVAVFSFGRLIVATPLGWISDKYRHKFTLLVSSSILFAGACFWANAFYLGGLPLLYIGQFILGLGTGSLGVTRSYVIEQTVAEERTNTISRLSAIQYAGFTATPLAGSALISLGTSTASFYGYEFPAYLISFLTLISIYLLRNKFLNIEEIESPEIREIQFTPLQSQEIVIPETSSVNPIIELETQNSEGSPSILEKMELCAEPNIEKNIETNVIYSKQQNPNIPAPLMKKYLFYVLILLNFTTRGAIAVYETQISKILLNNYNLSNIELGLTVTFAGLLGTCQLIFYKAVWTKNFSDYELMFIGMVVMGLSQIFVIIWGKPYNQPIWMIISAIYLMYGIGFPVANNAVLGCFSKLQKTGKQALIQSQFALVGSFSRILIPILSGYFESYIEPTSSFGIVSILMSISIILISIFQNHIFYYTDEKSGVKANDNELGPLSQSCYVSIGFSVAIMFISIGAMSDWGNSSW